MKHHQQLQTNKNYDVDSPGPILQESAGKLLKLTMLDDPIDVDATIHIPTDVDNMASCDDEVAFIIPQGLKGVYGFTGVDKFLQKDPEARNARYAMQTAFEVQPKTVGYEDLDLHCCHHWYKDLQFAMLIDNPIDDDPTYGIIVLLS